MQLAADGEVKLSIKEDKFGKYVEVDTNRHIIKSKALKESMQKNCFAILYNFCFNRFSAGRSSAFKGLSAFNVIKKYDIYTYVIFFCIIIILIVANVQKMYYNKYYFYIFYGENCGLY